MIILVRLGDKRQIDIGLYNVVQNKLDTLQNSYISQKGQ